MRHTSFKLTIAAATALCSSQAKAQVLFSDNFDAGTSNANYDVFTANLLSNGSANFAENYGALVFQQDDGDSGINLIQVPSAPHSTGGSTIGAVMRINDETTGQTNALSAYPKLQNFSGNYKLTYDMWMNYDGLAKGGPTSTEYALCGINQGAVGNRVAGPVIVGAVGGQNTGNTFVNNGDRGNGQDYRTYLNQANQTVRGFAAPNTAAPPATNQQNGEFNPYYADSTTGLFPAPEFETFGAPGKHWVTVEISQQAGVLTWKISNNSSVNPITKVITQYADKTNTSGNITLGYADFNTSSASAATRPYQFVVYDNVVVESVPTSLYWDINGATAGGGGATPTGAWDGSTPTTGVNFNSDSTGGAGGVLTPYTSVNEDVNFAAGTDGTGSYAVTVTGAQTAKSVKINRGNVSLTGGSISSATFNVAAGATGTVTSTISGPAGSVTKSGAGVFSVTKLPQANAVTITGGTVRVLHTAPTGVNPESGNNASVSRPTSLTIPGTGPLGTRVYDGKLDLTNNDLIIDYTGASPILNIEDMVRAGFNGGDFLGNGITSSIGEVDNSFIIAVADNAALSAPYGTANGGGLFSGVDVDLTSILVKFTNRVDLDLDGVVTPNDASVFGTNYDPGQPANWIAGDLDYDGFFTPNDASIFGTFYDPTLQSLPEPGSLALIGLLGLGLARRRR